MRIAILVYLAGLLNCMIGAYVFVLGQIALSYSMVISGLVLMMLGPLMDLNKKVELMQSHYEEWDRIIQK